ncbi:MAG: hypothetical protein H6765_09015 [Candidatus Peribacteria bacterium]|nr:MAG: hypothetical protein H6765_09015 [Candidatus Peribacteria bacterium]
MHKTYSLILCTLCIPLLVSAHQPRVPTGDQIQVTEPEISKAYYSELTGKPHVYTITSEQAFALYLNILTPYSSDADKKLSFRLSNNSDQEGKVFSGSDYQRSRFFEPFGYDSYWQGPEYRTQAAAGTYQIVVFSPNNKSKYVLAIGEKEQFNLQETKQALLLIPKLKKDFFFFFPRNFLLSPLGW